MKITIITCPQWGARPPKQGIETIGMSNEFVIHGTDGHHPEISNPADESVEEAIAYARSIQNFHMDVRGWNDSGHNFLVTRAGHILQGRWLTVSAIQAHHMVRSAHAGSSYGNEQIGIEHEHAKLEPPTPEQLDASSLLQAWVAWKYGRRKVLPAFPHHKYSNTGCPVNLEKYIPGMVASAQTILNREFI